MVGLEVPDRNGVNADVVLGYDTLQEYVDGNSSHGALVGRYANRIGGAKINVSGREYRLSANDNKVNHLHGGFFGYNKRVWTVDAMDGGDIRLRQPGRRGELPRNPENQREVHPDQQQRPGYRLHGGF